MCRRPKVSTSSIRIYFNSEHSLNRQRGAAHECPERSPRAAADRAGSREASRACSLHVRAFAAVAVLVLHEVELLAGREFRAASALTPLSVMTMNSSASERHTILDDRRRGTDVIRHAQAHRPGIPGCATTSAFGCSKRARVNRRAGKVACTMQAPCQIFMFCRPVCRFTQLPRLMSGRNRIGLSAGIEFTTSTALREVQMMSLSAFTSTDVLM